MSFLGFGLPAGVPSWGGMLSREGRSYMEIAPWLAIWPGVFLTVTVYSLNMFGDALRDLLDPRLRGASRVGAAAAQVGLTGPAWVHAPARGWPSSPVSKARCDGSAPDVFALEHPARASFGFATAGAPCRGHRA